MLYDLEGTTYVNKHLKYSGDRREIDAIIFFSYRVQYCEWNMAYVTHFLSNQIGYIFVCYKRYCKSLTLVLELTLKTIDCKKKNLRLLSYVSHTTIMTVKL